jgi:hypothetical protein
LAEDDQDLPALVSHAGVSCPRLRGREPLAEVLDRGLKDGHLGQSIDQTLTIMGATKSTRSAADTVR